MRIETFPITLLELDFFFLGIDPVMFVLYELKA